jgi:hypothetical protein
MEPTPRTRTLSDQEIGRLWHKHFPRCDNDLYRRQLCDGICSIIEFEAAFRDGTTHGARVDDALKSAGIARKEFDEMKADRLRGFDRFA